MQLEASKFPLAIGPWTNWPRRATISAPFAAKSVSAVCAKKRRKISERKSTCDTENAQVVRDSKGGRPDFD